MSNIDIIRAWKDEEYCNSLSEQQRSQLPENPVGIVELTDVQMESIAGGRPYTYYCNTSEAACAEYTTTPNTICQNYLI